ncbi:uroporphyrinogen decarboxylase [Streptomyces avermitilis]|uniref:Uroporphyrinogen decarboxylase n=1 Tax=Streptomyces avermitilis TaxID=33903 RepID=A0A4D4N079_STRAX|nr:uroporphyrinogen decarboxylase [Streptomyces avermitilis]
MRRATVRIALCECAPPAPFAPAPFTPAPFGARARAGLSVGRARLSVVSANDRPATGQPTATYESAFLKACRREPVPHTPVWFMRQAGRSLPEYLKVREGIPMLESCMRPELVAEITLQPVRRHNVDAAIYFSDIVVPLKAIGIDLDIKPGVGPVVEKPIRTRADLAQLRDLTPEDVSYVTEAIKLLTAELGETPLIGFAGAPFTLASYLVEGGPSKNHEHTKALMYGDPQLWADLLDRLAEITSAFLKVQIEAGASAVQLFDSWVGALAPADYRRSVMPASTKVFQAVESYGVPRIHFGVGTGELLGLMGEAGADVVGVDWRVPLDEAARRVGTGKALQGNLDPAVLFSTTEAVETKTREVLDAAAGLEGHVFNLGHGVPPTTDPDALTRLVEYVHTQTAR